MYERQGTGGILHISIVHAILNAQFSASWVLNAYPEL